MTDWRQAWRELMRPSTAAAERRLAQGVAYSRSGRVNDVRWSTGTLRGSVQGTRATPYVVEVRVKPLTAEHWERITNVLANEVGHSARLLAGHVPEGLEGELARSGVRLLPRREDLDTNCACDDTVWPCEHLAAVWLHAGEALTHDPFLLFRLRGRGRARLLEDLSEARRARGQRDRPLGLALADLSAEGWTHQRAPLEEVPLPDLESARLGAALRLLGDPPGWSGGPGSEQVFGPALRAAAERGRRWRCEAEDPDQEG
ncbi:MAG: hypothetical protein ACR2MA_06665 [Egibacteraceae bacterium]